MSYVDITFIEPTDLAELGGVAVEDAEGIIQFAEEAAERIENEPPVEVSEEETAGRTMAGHLADPSVVPTENVESAAVEGDVLAEMPTEGSEPEASTNGELIHSETPAEEPPIGEVSPNEEPALVSESHPIPSEESPPQS